MEAIFHIRASSALAKEGAPLWLFSAGADLVVFLGSALLSLIALWIGAQAGVLHGDTPDWAWIPAILLVDVAHVYSTGFRVYFDTNELKRRPWLYGLVPALGYIFGVALYSEGELIFWRVLAYLAVFHFVRQQYGWVMLYRARLGERERLGYWIDSFAIYAASIYPLIYWHAQLPRQFWWFLPGDFLIVVPNGIERSIEPIYWSIMGAYAFRSLYRRMRLGQSNPGKDIVVATTAICWYVGIITFNSDYAFTVTNVFIHGIPYLALIYRYNRARWRDSTGSKRKSLFSRCPLGMLAIIWALAYVEEMLWDRTIWHERGWMFGPAWDLSSLKLWLVPLLALPQISHYVLDGFIWRRKDNPELFRTE